MKLKSNFPIAYKIIKETIDSFDKTIKMHETCLSEIKKKRDFWANMLKDFEKDVS